MKKLVVVIILAIITCVSLSGCTLIGGGEGGGKDADVVILENRINTTKWVKTNGYWAAVGNATDHKNVDLSNIAVTKAQYDQIRFYFIRPAQEYNINSVTFTVVTDVDCTLYLGIGTGYDYKAFIVEPVAFDFQADTPREITIEMNFEPSMANDADKRRFTIKNVMVDENNTATYTTNWTITDLELNITKK